MATCCTSVAPGNNKVLMLTEESGIWEHTETLQEPANNNTAFGTSITVSGDTIAIGAPEDDTEGEERGAVHLFTYSNSSWTHSQKIDSSFSGLTLENRDKFGSSVTLSADNSTLAVGAPEDDTAGNNRGTVHIFTKANNSWTYAGKIGHTVTEVTLNNNSNIGSAVTHLSRRQHDIHWCTRFQNNRER